MIRIKIIRNIDNFGKLMVYIIYILKRLFYNENYENQKFINEELINEFMELGCNNYPIIIFGWRENGNKKKILK